MNNIKDTEKSTNGDKQKPTKITDAKIYAIASLVLSILSMLLYLFVGYYMFTIAKLIFYIGNLVLCASAVVCAMFAYKEESKTYTLISICSLVISINIAVCLVFEIVRTYIL